MASQLATSALAPSSQAAYTRAFNKYRNFCACHIIICALPISVEFFACFLTSLFDAGLPHSSISSISSALSYFHKWYDVPDPSQTFLIKQILTAIRKQRPSRDSRHPISIHTLQLLVNILPALNLPPYDSSMLLAMFVLAFHFALRIGEMTDTVHNLFFHDIVACPAKLTIRFSSFKHAPSHVADHVISASLAPTCPVQAVNNYLALRGNSFGPLFILNSNPISRDYFVSKLKACFLALGISDPRFNTHSFRIGAASYWALNKGYSDLQIQKLGRWQSNAFLKYIRGQIEHSLD